MKKSAAIIVVIMALSLTACNSNIENNSSEFSDTETTSQTGPVLTYDQQETVSSEDEINEPEEVKPNRTIIRPEVKLINSNTLSVTSDLKNAENVKIYSYEVSSESGGVGHRI